MDRKAISKRVAELLDLIQLPNRAKAYCSELSGGQQQRVALARALSFSPQLLLMDEPSSARSTSNCAKRMQVELRRLQRELQITTILVTHDQHEAMTLADRIVIMAAGVIQQIGSPDELYERPSSAFCRKLHRTEQYPRCSKSVLASIAGGFRNETEIQCRSSKFCRNRLMTLARG